MSVLIGKPIDKPIWPKKKKNQPRFFEFECKEGQVVLARGPFTGVLRKAIDARRSVLVLAPSVPSLAVFDRGRLIALAKRNWCPFPPSRGGPD